MKRPSFDAVGPFYPALEGMIFGGLLTRARSTFFDRILQSNRILLVGEGNGRFLKSLVACKVGGCIRVVEHSSVMINLAKKRIDKMTLRTDVRFIHSDFQCFSSEQSFDCVVTHFFLDQFLLATQLSLVRKINDVSAENAIWINVDFTPPRTFGGRTLMWLQYTFFRVVSGIETRRCFDETTSARQCRWEISKTDRFLGGLVLAKVYRRPS